MLQQTEDQMLCFGSVTCKNFNGDLRNVANVAENSKNQNVRVQILRNGQVIMASYINKKELYLTSESLEPKNMFIKEFFLIFSDHDSGTKAASMVRPRISWMSHGPYKVQ